MDHNKLKEIEWQEWTTPAMISEATKLEYIQTCIRRLEANPEEHETSISSGDTMITVERCGDYDCDEGVHYEIWEYLPRRVGDIYNA